MPCHGNLNAGKRSPLPGQTLLLEDSAVDTLVHSSCGTLVMTLLHGLLTAPSWHTCTSLACGWALAGDRHTITTYLWLTGAATVKHGSRCSGFLGCPQPTPSPRSMFHHRSDVERPRPPERVSRPLGGGDGNARCPRLRWSGASAVSEAVQTIPSQLSPSRRGLGGE